METRSRHAIIDRAISLRWLPTLPALASRPTAGVESRPRCMITPNYRPCPVNPACFDHADR